MPDPLAEVSAEELYEQGLALGRAGDLQRAEQYLVASMEKGKDRREVVPMIARICITMNRFSAALAYVEPVLADYPESWTLRRLVGTLREGLGEHVEARRQYLRVLESEPNDPVTHYFLAMSYLESSRSQQEATRYMERYLELAPEGRHAREVRELLNEPVAVPEPTVQRIQRIERIEQDAPTSDVTEGADGAPVESEGES